MAYQIAHNTKYATSRILVPLRPQLRRSIDPAGAARHTPVGRVGVQESHPLPTNPEKSPPQESPTQQMFP